jgi:hypothetical protein
MEAAREMDIQIRDTEAAIDLIEKKQYLFRMDAIDVERAYNKANDRYNRLNTTGNRRKPEYLIEAEDKWLRYQQGLMNLNQNNRSIQALKMTLKVLIDRKQSIIDSITNPTDPQN